MQCAVHRERRGAGEARSYEEVGTSEALAAFHQILRFVDPLLGGALDLPDELIGLAFTGFHVPEHTR